MVVIHRLVGQMADRAIVNFSDWQILQPLDGWALKTKTSCVCPVNAQTGDTDTATVLQTAVIQTHRQTKAENLNFIALITTNYYFIGSQDYHECFPQFSQAFYTRLSQVRLSQAGLSQVRLSQVELSLARLSQVRWSQVSYHRSEYHK